MTPPHAATTPWNVSEDLVLALLIRDAVAAAVGVANLRAQDLTIDFAALTASLDYGTWLCVSDVLAAGATATSVSAAAAALTQVGIKTDSSCRCCNLDCCSCHLRAAVRNLNVI